MNMFCNFFCFLGGKNRKILGESKSPKQGKTREKKIHLCDPQVNLTQPIVQQVLSFYGLMVGGCVCLCGFLFVFVLMGFLVFKVWWCSMFVFVSMGFCVCSDVCVCVCVCVWWWVWIGWLVYHGSVCGFVCWTSARGWGRKRGKKKDGWKA